MAMVNNIVRAKKITHPLDEQAKSRLIGGDGYVSSGSEHSAYGVDDSPCLSELVHGFFEFDEDLETESAPAQPDPDRVESSARSTQATVNTLKRYVTNNADPYKKLLSFHISKAVGTFSSLKLNKPLFRRNVMSYLREMGHNAAICKTKWDSTGGLTAGNYEFIDVLNHSTRYFIDLDFASEFEIARATEHYSTLLKILPSVSVGTAEELKKIVRLMSDEAKRSLKSKELSLPPWRKNRFMQNKWLGPYRRTTNPVQGGSKVPVFNGVNCRRVGFDADNVNDVSSRLPVRTR